MSEVNCPHKYKFGKECDEHDECEVCPLWEKCINFETPGWKKKEVGKKKIKNKII